MGDHRAEMKPGLLCVLVCCTLLVHSSVAEDTSSSVVEVTMDNFVEVVTDANKHALVMFYAPWCGECKEFKPGYEAVAAAHAKSDNVVIAQMDGEAQAVFAKMYKIESFPSLKLFTKKDKKGVGYTGELTTEALTKWLEEETYEAPTIPQREPPKIITREDGTIEMTETFYHYGDGMPPM